MTVRGGGIPTCPLALTPTGRMGPPLRSFAADAHDCIMVRVFGPAGYNRLWRDSTAPDSGLPSDRHPTASSVLLPRLNFLTKKAPYKGLSADFEEKRVLASDLDTVIAADLCRLLRKCE